MRSVKNFVYIVYYHKLSAMLRVKILVVHGKSHNKMFHRVFQKAFKACTNVSSKHFIFHRVMLWRKYSYFEAIGGTKRSIRVVGDFRAVALRFDCVVLLGVVSAHYSIIVWKIWNEKDFICILAQGGNFLCFILPICFMSRNKRFHFLFEHPRYHAIETLELT